MAALKRTLLLTGVLMLSAGGSTATDNGASPSPSRPSGVVPTSTVTVSPSEPASPTPSACESFGSTADVSSADPATMSSLTGDSMRVGQHDCYERFVFEMTGTGVMPGWTVGYRDPMLADPSGQVVDLRGGADLEVLVRVWTVPEHEGRPTEWPPFTGPDDILTTGFTALQEARNLYAFEGVTQIGLGLDKQRPFRVEWLDGPPRLVVDVATG